MDFPLQWHLQSILFQLSVCPPFKYRCHQQKLKWQNKIKKNHGAASCHCFFGPTLEPISKKKNRGKPIYLPPLRCGFLRDRQHTWKKKTSPRNVKGQVFANHIPEKTGHPSGRPLQSRGRTFLGADRFGRDFFWGPENLRWKMHYQDVAWDVSTKCRACSDLNLTAKGIQKLVRETICMASFWGIRQKAYFQVLFLFVLGGVCFSKLDVSQNSISEKVMGFRSMSLHLLKFALFFSKQKRKTHRFKIGKAGAVLAIPSVGNYVWNFRHPPPRPKLDKDSAGIKTHLSHFTYEWLDFFSGWIPYF